MADSAAGAAMKIGLFQTLRVRPGIDILKSWQGIVEIVLRSTAAVSVHDVVRGCKEARVNGRIDIISSVSVSCGFCWGNRRLL